MFTQRQFGLLTVLLLCRSICFGETQEEVSLKQPGWISSLAFSSDGQFLANSCSDNTAHLRRTDTGAEIAAFVGHSDYVSSVALSLDARTLATGSFDHTARLWDISSKQSRVLRGHSGAVMTVAFSPDGILLATGSLDSTIMLWHVETARPVTTLHAHKSWVNSVAFASDGATLFSGSSDGTIKIWNVAKHKFRQSIDVTNTEIRAIAVSRDGEAIAAGLRYGIIKLFTNGKERLSFKASDGDVWSIAFNPAGSILVSGGGDWNKPGQVKLWDVQTGKLNSVLPNPGEVLSVACSPDRNRIASGTWDRTLTIWQNAY